MVSSAVRNSNMYEKCKCLTILCFPIALNERKNDTHNSEVNHYLLTSLVQHRSIFNYVFIFLNVI